MRGRGEQPVRAPPLLASGRPRRSVAARRCATPSQDDAERIHTNDAPELDTAVGPALVPDAIHGATAVVIACARCIVCQALTWASPYSASPSGTSRCNQVEGDVGAGGHVEPRRLGVPLVPAHERRSSRPRCRTPNQVAGREVELLVEAGHQGCASCDTGAGRKPSASGPRRCCDDPAARQLRTQGRPPRRAPRLTARAGVGRPGPNPPGRLGDPPLAKYCQRNSSGNHDLRPGLRRLAHAARRYRVRRRIRRAAHLDKTDAEAGRRSSA